MHNSKITMYLEADMLFLTPFVYLSVTRPNQLLNRKNNLLMPEASFLAAVGLNNKVHSAGVSDKAINADKITDIAMVIANCWYNLPTMPGINPTGTNTAARINAMATTGADMSFMALYVASLADICCSSI